jgi:hypothetical protein
LSSSFTKSINSFNAVSCPWVRVNPVSIVLPLYSNLFSLISVGLISVSVLTVGWVGLLKFSNAFSNAFNI